MTDVFVISEKCDILGYYAASSGNNPKESSSHLLRVGSLKLSHLTAYRNQFRCSGITTILQARVRAVDMRQDILCERIKLNRSSKPPLGSPFCYAFFVLFRYVPCRSMNYKQSKIKKYVFSHLKPNHHHHHVFQYVCYFMQNYLHA